MTDIISKFDSKQMCSYHKCQRPKAPGNTLCSQCRGDDTRVTAYLKKWRESLVKKPEPADPLRQPTCLFCANCRKIFASKAQTCACGVTPMRIETDSIERDKAGIIVGCRVAQYTLQVAGRLWKHSA